MLMTYLETTPNANVQPTALWEETRNLAGRDPDKASSPPETRRAEAVPLATAFRDVVEGSRQLPRPYHSAGGSHAVQACSGPRSKKIRQNPVMVN
jgi:hypothetical protein